MFNGKIKVISRVGWLSNLFSDGEIIAVENGAFESLGEYYWSNDGDGFKTFEAIERRFDDDRGTIKFELVEEPKMFTKDDLKCGMIVTLRNGNNAFVMLNTGVGDNDFLVYGDGNRILHLGEYANDLTYARTATFPKDYDIVKVEQDTRCLELLQKRGYGKKTVFDRDAGIGCKPEHKFKIGDFVKVSDTGKIYSSYTQFVEKMRPDCKSSFIEFGHPHENEILKVIACGDHLGGDRDFLYIVKDKTTHQIFVFSEDGLEKA